MIEGVSKQDEMIVKIIAMSLALAIAKTLDMDEQHYKRACQKAYENYFDAAKSILNQIKLEYYITKK